MGKLTLKGDKKKAWQAFSLYIRTKYSTDGICTCFTCDREYQIKESQCGHGVSGRSNSILFLEEICRPQCAGCNMWQGGRYDVFVPKLIELYGLDGYREFVKMKSQPKKLTINDFLDIEDYYKKSLSNIIK